MERRATIIIVITVSNHVDVGPHCSSSFFSVIVAYLTVYYRRRVVVKGQL
jgi:hypothetical protein